MINLNGIISVSLANGPGRRMVIWFQGCSLKCHGCFNPESHPHSPHLMLTIDELFHKIADIQNQIEGITISGGEPFEQPEALLDLVTRVRKSTSLSILVFSGYTIAEIESMPLGSSILANIDVLIDGRYDVTRHLAHGLRGSSNQNIHFLTSRYSSFDIESTPDTEILISPDGNITISGINPLDKFSD